MFRPTQTSIFIYYNIHFQLNYVYEDNLHITLYPKENEVGWTMSC